MCVRLAVGTTIQFSPPVIPELVLRTKSGTGLVGVPGTIPGMT